MPKLTDFATIEPANDEGYDVRLWSRDGNNYMTVGHADDYTGAYTLLADVCSIVASWTRAWSEVAT